MSRNFMADLMNEKILYGGCVATRAEVYADAIRCGCNRWNADRFAFLPVPVSEADATGRLTLAQARRMEGSTDE